MAPTLKWRRLGLSIRRCVSISRKSPLLAGRFLRQERLHQVMDADKFVKLPIQEATVPKDGYVCLANRYWIVTENNELLFYIGNSRKKHYCSPQCNYNESITKRLCKDGTKVLFIPFVFVPHNCHDYV